MIKKLLGLITKTNLYLPKKVYEPYCRGHKRYDYRLYPTVMATLPVRYQKLNNMPSRVNGNHPTVIIALRRNPERIHHERIYSRF